MSGASWLQLLALLVLLAISTPLIGIYMAKVYATTDNGQGARATASSIRSSGVIYRVCGVDEKSEQRWTTYAISLLAFSFASVVILYAQLRLQGHLPLNPDHLGRVGPALSLNTSVSFLTNTNWQNYVGESTMSYLTPDGRARGPQLRVRGGRRRGRRRAHPRDRPAALEHPRQLLGRPHPHDRARPASAGDRLHARAREPGRRPELPRLADRHDGERPDADDSRRARSRARKRSRRSARTAAVPTTRTPHTRSRTRTRSRTSSRSGCCSRSPSASPGRSGRWSAT